MGAGKKTLEDSPSKRGGGRRKFRGLKKSELAGVIFGCTHDTYKECVTQLIFGLPASHIAYVQNIGHGMPLFLFNYSDRKMHGIFQAASCGQMNINPSGWTGDVSGKTQFPAQVCVCIKKSCEPLSESAFKNIISENYYTDSHIWFELDQSQVVALTTLFLSRSNKRSSDIDFTKSSENRTWSYKRAPSSSSVCRTASAGTLMDSAEMGLDANGSGDWTMVPPKNMDIPYGIGGDPWEESSQSSDKNKEIYKIIDSDYEKATYGEIIRSPTVLHNNKPESVEIEPASNVTVKESSKEYLEFPLIENFNQLAINSPNCLPNPTAQKCAKDDNNIIIMLEQQMQQEIADSRCYVEKTHDEFHIATEIKEHQNKNLLLEQKQVPGSGNTPQKVGQLEYEKEGCGQELQFNFLGLPIREGEKQCPDYILTGFCKYDVTCKFHHPEPVSESESVSSSPLQMNRTNPLASSSEKSYIPVHSSGNFPKDPYALNIHMQEHTTYMDVMYPFPQDMAPMPVLSNNYQTPIKLLSFEGNQHPNGTQTISAIGTGPFGVQSRATITGRNTFPERPGQPECQQFLKTGNCKFAAACRFHHPRNNEQSINQHALFKFL